MLYIFFIPLFIFSHDALIKNPNVLVSNKELLTQSPLNQSSWSTYNDTQKQNIINNLLIENAHQQISPLKSLYLEMHSLIYSQELKLIPASDSIFFGALYNNGLIYSEPLKSEYRLAHAYEFASYNPNKNGIYTMFFRIFYADSVKDDSVKEDSVKEEWIDYSKITINNQGITIDDTSKNQNRMKSRSLPLSTANIYSLLFCTARLGANEMVSDIGAWPIPSGVLITLKNGSQFVWEVAHPEIMAGEVVEVPDIIIPVNYASFAQPSLEYAIQLQKTINRLKHPLYFLSRLNFQSMIWDSPVQRQLDDIQNKLKRYCKTGIGFLVACLAFHKLTIPSIIGYGKIR